jgi:dihydrofolate reductase
MSRVVIPTIAVSLDGYMAGPHQSLDDPKGAGGAHLHEWVFATRAGRAMIGQTGGETGIDDDIIRRSFVGVGATIMGRNMFGPVRGDWADESWRGWWGDSPPFHHPVFVLTHFARPSVEMADGTTFHFVTDGIASALERALEAAQGADVRVGGGASTLHQFIAAQLIDEMNVAVVPVVLGRGERLFEDLGTWPAGYACDQFVASSRVAHYRIVRDVTSTP